MGPGPSGFDFERDWPALRAQVERALARWRIPASLEEDILQETGIRIWNLREQIDPSRSVEAFAGRIAVNLLKDHLRRERVLAHGADLSAKAVPQDVENEVIARDEWQRVRAALSKLNPARRAALIAAVLGDGDDRTPAAMRMMKMRARKQLRFLMEEITKAKAGCVVIVQHSWEAVARGMGLRSPHAPLIAQVASAAVIAVTAGALAFPSPEDAPGHNEGVDRARLQLSGGEVASVEQTDVTDWEREIQHFGELERETPKRTRERARKLFRVGPLSYGPGDSVVSGTMQLDPQTIENDAGIDVSPKKLICRVGLFGKCKDRKKQ